MPKQKSDPQKKHSSQSNKTRDEATWIDTDRVVNKAQDIVNSAVNVLEEEIAAGILAAKRIEKKLIDVDEIRNDPDALMNRIRRDSHEVLDLFIDAFASLTGQMNSVVEALKKETEEQQKSNEKAQSKKKKSSSSVTLLEPDKPLKAGETVTLVLSLYDDDTAGTKKISLRKTDFTGPGNQVINKRALRIHPKTVSLHANEEKEMEFIIKLPKNSLPGDYNMLLTDEDNPSIRVLLTLKVIP